MSAPMLILIAALLLLAGLVGAWVMHMMLNRAPHVHAGYTWDNYYEHCKCGVSAGDLQDPQGHRYIFFSDWPKEALE